MDLGIIIALGAVAFGFGIWFNRISNKLNTLDDRLAPLVALHKKEIIEYYLEKGTVPNPGMTPRTQYLIDKLQAGTISSVESQEFTNTLNREKEEAQRKNNTDAIVAILGLIALIYVLNELTKK
jgi:hypothetical protein